MCVWRILRESRYAFVIQCRFNEIHFELFNRTIFRYFYEAINIFGSITLFDSDLTQKLVQGACYETSYSYFYSFHDHAYILPLSETNFWVEIVGSDFI